MEREQLRSTAGALPARHGRSETQGTGGEQIARQRRHRGAREPECLGERGAIAGPVLTQMREQGRLVAAASKVRAPLVHPGMLERCEDSVKY